MNSISLQVLVHGSLATAIPVVDNGMGKSIMGLEEIVTDFAVSNGNNVDNLPNDITICSSLASGAFLGPLSPFQLLYQNGKPWISVYFYGAQKDSRHHRITFFVSFSLHLHYSIPSRI